MNKPNQSLLPRVITSFKELIPIGFGQVLSAIGSIILVKVLTSEMPPSEYGALSLGITASVLLTQLVFGPLSQASLRYFSIAEKSKELREYIGSVYLIIIRFSAVIIAILTLLLIYGYLYSWGFLLLVLGSTLYALIQGNNSVIDNIQNAARNRKVAAFHLGMANWFKLAGAIALIKIIGVNSGSVMLGYLMGVTIVCFSEFIFLSKTIIPLEELSKLNTSLLSIWQDRVIKYSWPFATWGMFTFVQQTSDRWALGLMTNASEVGRYTTLYQLSAYPVLFFSGIISQFIEPIVYSRAGDGSEEHMLRNSDRLIRWLIFGAILTSTLLASGSIFFHKDVFRLLVGKEYQSVSNLMPWMIIAGGMFVAGQMSALFLTTRNLLNPLILPKVVTALIGMVLSFLGAKYIGIYGVVYSQVIFSLMYFGWVVFVTHHEMKGSLI